MRTRLMLVASRVAQEHADRDLVKPWIGAPGAAWPQGAEDRERTVLKADLARVDELENGDGRDRLGNAGEPELRLGLRRGAGIEACPAEPARVDEPTILRQAERTARYFVPPEQAPHHVI